MQIEFDAIWLALTFRNGISIRAHSFLTARLISMVTKCVSFFKKKRRKTQDMKVGAVDSGEETDLDRGGGKYLAFACYTPPRLL